jgi:hypothetical protein
VRWRGRLVSDRGELEPEVEKKMKIRRVRCGAHQ